MKWSSDLLDGDSRGEDGQATYAQAITLAWGLLIAAGAIVALFIFHPWG